MKRLTSVLIIVALMFLVACGGGSSDIEKPSDEVISQYLEKAKEVITLLNNGDYEGLSELSTDKLMEALTDDVRTQINKDLSSKGEFVEFGAGDAVTQKDSSTSETYIITQQIVKYEKGEYILTVNFDEEGKVAGLFYK